MKKIKTLEEFSKVALKFLLDGLPPMAFGLAFDGVLYHTPKGAKTAAKMIYEQRNKKEIKKWLKFSRKHGLNKGDYLHKELTKLMDGGE